MKSFKDWLDRKPAGKKTKMRLPARSPKRIKEDKIYKAKAKEFLAKHPLCQVWLTKMDFNEEHLIQFNGGHVTLAGDLEFAPRATEIHHIEGRTGGNFLNEKTWMAVSRYQHEWIHANPAAARRLGFLRSKA